jgi:hypothetical protein
MGVPGNANALLLASAAVSGGYQVSRSLRFDSSASSSLTRSPASASNRRTFTWSGWVKRAKSGGSQYGLFGGGGYFHFSFLSGDTLNINDSAGFNLTTNSVYRDFSAWYHILLAVDTTQATASNRLKLYVNGIQALFTGSTYASQNADTDVNTTAQHTVGALIFGGSVNSPFDGYLADVHFIDGQALDPSSFTTTDLTTGQLIPKAYTGSYGTNGFKLNFSDNSTTAALGTDTSGNGNTWTVNNLSVTAGSGNDSLVDTPTSYGTDTGVGGSVRGNYSTWNPLVQPYGSIALTNGNLENTSGGSVCVSTIGMPPSGKYYVEVSGTGCTGGVCPLPRTTQIEYDLGSGTTGVIGIAVNRDAGEVKLYKDNVLQSTTSFSSAGISADATLFIQSYSGSGAAPVVLNAGQRAFAYTAPSGFKTLCDTNLPAPVVAKPDQVMGVKLWTGNASTQTISGLGFSPDLVWIKGRSQAYGHRLLDVVRGATNALASSSTAAEFVESTGLTAFNSDGFSLGAAASYNDTATTYVGWAWDAGTSTVTNNSGSISSTVRANPAAGFSVVSYTGTGSAATVGHGLGVAPAFMIFKNRSASGTNWFVYHQSLGATKYLLLDSTVGQDTSSTVFNNTNPTSSILTVGTWVGTNGSGNNMISYCFSPVSGYSSFGSYTGGGTSGRFVYTGFRPKLIWVKNYNDNSYPSYTGWYMWDSVRGAYNYNQSNLNANSSNNEGIRNTGGAIGTIGVDLLSNGFCLRGSDDVDTNWGSGQYIYCAWAESPFQYARAR